MTTAELNEILDDENRKLTANELKEVVYQLQKDCINEQYEHIMRNEFEKAEFYAGEVDAFYICLDLLRRLGGDHDERN